MKEYITNFDRDAIDHWDNYQAVREFVQNYLDSTEDRYFEIGVDHVTFCNKGVKVSNGMLKTGKSDKRGDVTKRGQYGTGSIFAMCVLSARGVTVEIHNDDVLWIPKFKPSSVFEGDEVLVIEECFTEPSGNFTVTISGLSEEDINNIKQANLMFQEDREVIASSPYGDVIANVDSFGEVYCGSIFVMQTKGFSYSYNIKPEYLKLNQDRESCSEWDLQNVTAKLITSTGNETFIEEAVKLNTLDTQHIKYYCSVPDVVQDTLATEFITNNKGKVITSDYSDHQHNEKVGTPSIYESNTTLVNAIQESSVYIDAVANIELVEKQTIDEFVEELKESIMQIVHSNMDAENGAKIEELLDCLTEESNNWSGDVEEGLPF